MQEYFGTPTTKLINKDDKEDTEDRKDKEGTKQQHSKSPLANLYETRRESNTQAYMLLYIRED